ADAAGSPVPPMGTPVAHDGRRGFPARVYPSGQRSLDDGRRPGAHRLSHAPPYGANRLAAPPHGLVTRKSPLPFSGDADQKGAAAEPAGLKRQPPAASRGALRFLPRDVNGEAARRR